MTLTRPIAAALVFLALGSCLAAAAELWLTLRTRVLKTYTGLFAGTSMPEEA